MIPNVGPLELIVVLAVALIVLGPKRRPQVGSSLGKAVRDFKAGLDRDEREPDAHDDAAGLEPAADERDRDDAPPDAERGPATAVSRHRCRG